MRLPLEFSDFTTGKPTAVPGATTTLLDADSSLETRKVMEENGRFYRCFECGKKFKRFNSLEDHYRTHTGRKPFKCSVCAKCFTSKNTLRKHREKKHINSCPRCSESFNNKTLLEKHIHDNCQTTHPPASSGAPRDCSSGLNHTLRISGTQLEHPSIITENLR